MSYIFSFSTRNSALKFLDAVKDYGGKASFVNTPRLSAGCGMSVKCDDYSLCQGVLNRGYYNNLKAVYAFDGIEYKSIYNTDN